MANGVEAVQLDYVALDASVRCNRTFFRSSRHFKNTIFAVPRVEVGGNGSTSVCAKVGPEGKRAFDINATENKDEFLLFLRIFFPTTAEKMANAGASQHTRDYDACNLDQVRDFLNRNATAENRVDTISRLPLTDIEVSIPGIEEPGRVLKDKGEADIINYYGTTQTVLFKINAKEYRYFINEVLKPDGLAANVKMVFKAKHRDGAIIVTIDTRTLSGSFATAVKGRTVMTKAEVAATIRGLNFSSAIKMSVDAGSKGSTERAEAMAMEKAMEAFASVPEVPSANPQQTDDAGDAQVSVKAVIDALASKVSRSFELEYNATESATAISKIVIRTKRMEDPNITQIELKAGYTHPTSSFYLRAGQSVSFIPAYTYIEDIDYDETRYHLTLAEMQELELHRRFPSMTSPYMTITNQNRNGVIVAEGTWVKHAIAPFFYRWRREQSFPVRSCTNATFKRLRPSQQMIEELPVLIGFSNEGGRGLYTLAELAQGKPGVWEGSYDLRTGQVRIKALMDLGLVNFKDEMKEDEDVVYRKSPVELDLVSEEVTNILGSMVRGVEKILNSDSQAISKQKTIVIHVLRQNEGGETLPPSVMSPSLPEVPRPPPRDETMSDQSTVPQK
jgi:hypothetical protein